VTADRSQLKSAREARSVAGQLCLALAVAERALQFEHRDLHVGNVLVRRTAEPLLGEPRRAKWGA